MIRVGIADDEALARMAMRVLVEREPDLCCVGEAANGSTALELARAGRLDVLLLDVRMPGLSGLDVLRAVRSDTALDATEVVVITTFELDEYIVEALQAGAGGFLVKEQVPAELVDAIRAVHAGHALLSPSVTRRVVEIFGRHVAPASHPVAVATLTDREREIVSWVATGRSNDEIAQELFLSPATVRTHVGRALVKLGARDRSQLVVFAVRAGLGVPPT
ncbi:response regulator [Cellulomonas dongxiuzhuiae]|uniref:Response regulator transcription factor n=1 Tax=Cellulomonas dongxiuzhuiae TaxID=2819979 RepID=A0ABX8GIM2_9CELL|nr:response regulator transcription factor [Cellulomonas dongxiuzhuiae]MBO3089172.1 response regulator transcription factor [Cellulomonas dongxiuzhuiae]MBO3095048.1 response regulator transcription factor [Cellulomonas dongxiuzhuiae]QWC16062.1 response regulator transcription factor [Cellulomonas dongxiuzhuiae]